MSFKHNLINIFFNDEKLVSCHQESLPVELILNLKEGNKIQKNTYFLGRHTDTFFSIKFEKVTSTDININISDLPKQVISKFFFDQKVICGVIGCKGSSARFTPEVQLQAKQMGEIIAEYGFTTLTGGLSGVMQKAAEGARLVGGETLGILPGSEKKDANEFIKYVIPSGIGIARNYIIAQASDILIALNGGRGTLEEMCYGLDFEKKVLSLNSWEIPEVDIINTVSDAKKYLDTLFFDILLTNLKRKYETI